MATEKDIAGAERFAASYKPGDDDHPDLESRVVMYRRAVEGGDKRVIAVHARTLVRFVGHVGLDIPAAKKKAAAKKTTGS